MNIYFPIFDSRESVSKEYRLIKDGLENHPGITQVSDIDQCQYIILMSSHFDDPKYGQQFQELHKKYPEKTIFLDYSDWASGLWKREKINGKSFNWKLYFKRSIVEKNNEINQLRNYQDLKIINISYGCKLNFFPETIHFNKNRDIDISYLFDKGYTLCPYNKKNRGQVYTFLKNKSFENLNTYFKMPSQNSTVGRSKECTTYFNALRSSKIVITCNPDMWEGDSRLWEAMSSGCLVFVDRMLTPIKNPLIDGEHLIYYDLTDQGLGKLYEQILYFLNHEDERINIAREGYEFVKKYHTSIRRIDHILDEVKKMDQ